MRCDGTGKAHGHRRRAAVHLRREGAKLNRTQVFSLRKTPKGYEGRTTLYDGTRLIKLPDTSSPNPSGTDRAGHGRAQPEPKSAGRRSRDGQSARGSQHMQSGPRTQSEQRKQSGPRTQNEQRAQSGRWKASDGSRGGRQKAPNGQRPNKRQQNERQQNEQRRQNGQQLSDRRQTRGEAELRRVLSGSMTETGRLSEGVPTNSAPIDRVYSTDGRSYPTYGQGFSANNQGHSAGGHSRTSGNQGYHTSNQGHPADGRSHPADGRGYPANGRSYPTDGRGYSSPQGGAQRDPRRRSRPPMSEEDKRRLAAAKQAQEQAEREMARQRAERRAEQKRQHTVDRRRRRRAAIKFIASELLRGILRGIPWLFALIGMTVLLAAVAGAIISVDLRLGSSTHPDKVEYLLTDADKREVSKRTTTYNAVFISGSPYLKMSDLASDFDLTVAGDGKSYKLITQSGDIIKLTVSSGAVTLGSYEARLSSPIIARGDEVYIPVELLGDYLTGVSTEYGIDEKKGIGRLTVTREITDYTVSVSDGKQPIYADLGFNYRESPDAASIAEDSLPEAIAAATDPNPPPPENGDGTTGTAGTAGAAGTTSTAG